MQWKPDVISKLRSFRIVRYNHAAFFLAPPACRPAVGSFSWRQHTAQCSLTEEAKFRRIRRQHLHVSQSQHHDPRQPHPNKHTSWLAILYPFLTKVYSLLGTKRVDKGVEYVCVVQWAGNGLFGDFLERLALSLICIVILFTNLFKSFTNLKINFLYT